MRERVENKGWEKKCMRKSKSVIHTCIIFAHKYNVRNTRSWRECYEQTCIPTNRDVTVSTVHSRVGRQFMLKSRRCIDFFKYFLSELPFYSLYKKKHNSKSFIYILIALVGDFIIPIFNKNNQQVFTHFTFQCFDKWII